MKKIYPLIIALLITAGIANAQDGWVTHVADNRVSVKFPVEPKELTPGSFITTDNAGVAYVFTVVDFVQVANIDSVALAPLKNTPEFAAQIKTGLLQSLPGVDMADFTIGTYKGFTSYTSTGTMPLRKNTICLCLLLAINCTVYQLLLLKVHLQQGGILFGDRWW